MDPAAGGAATWLDFGRLMVADYVLRATPGDDADEELGDDVIERAVVGTDYIEALRHRLDESLAEAAPFSIVAANADLSGLDAAVLAIALAVEADPALGRLLNSVEGRDRPANVSLRALSMMLDGQREEPPVHSRLVSDAPLRRAALCALEDFGGDGLFHDQTVVVPHSLVWTVLGARFDDPDLPSRVEHLELGDDGANRDGEPLVVITGNDRRLRLLEAVRRTSGTRFLVSDAPADATGWAALVRAATVHGCGLVVEVTGSLATEGRRSIERATHISWAILSARDIADDELPDRPWSEYRAADRLPTDDEWRAVLGDDVPRTHPLTHEQLDRVARLLPAVGGDLDRAVRRLVSGRLEQLATRIRPTRTWDDIVLSTDRMAQLHAVADRYRHRATVFERWGFASDTFHGLVAVFSGPSGTGKTLAAEVIAAELGLDLFKLNLSAVVSKYIGETEKNLEEIFGAAAAGDLVLFFDEADALFGKRSEVRDARDRYANIEVAYLLQRIERYEGVVILATNLEKNIDDAFMRRIQSRVEFAMPTVEERHRIWQRNVPPTAPVDGVDLAWLAGHFEITGASIRNATIHAAFHAAATGTPITMATAVLGVAQEYRKLGRLIKESDFGEFFEDAIAIN